MTTQTDALPACPHGNEAKMRSFVSSHGYVTIHTTGCRCRVSLDYGTQGAPNLRDTVNDACRAAWTALCAPHALAASRAEVERLRKLIATNAISTLSDPPHDPPIAVCNGCGAEATYLENTEHGEGCWVDAALAAQGASQ